MRRHILLKIGLGNMDKGIKPESVNAMIDPKLGNICHRTSHFGISPVQIRHLFVK